MYFRTNYRHLAYPTREDGGLYNAQIGAIHAIASHFTIRHEPAVVTMPTGSGKTAVLMMTPFVLRSSRALVITPSKLVRGQIAEDFHALVTLRKARVIPDAVPSPKVFEEKNRIDSLSRWEAFRNFDVVVATPNCVSPGYHGVPASPDDLFDLILIDEAHHSPAKTWRDLLSAFQQTPTALFTATPFRRDKGEISGRFLYHYPLARAYRDGIFGRINFRAVTPTATDTHDIDVARQAEAVVKADRAAGLNHFVMVRTDQLTRADELDSLYRSHTALRLQLVHSRFSNAHVKKVIVDLREGRLDGVICVDMMGEGFDFPKLKIAAIHSPHKSLEVTLQFIGRFARTNARDIGDATFIAVPSDIELEGQRLFVDGAIWQEIISGLSQNRIAEEIGIREAIQDFQPPGPEETDISDLSLYSLYPRGHAKVFDVVDQPDLGAAIEFPHQLDVIYDSLNDDRSARVILTRVRSTPKWSASDLLIDVSHGLFIIYYDSAHRLLFINASESVEGVYHAITTSLGGRLAPLPTSLIRRVLKDLTNQRVFNLGMRNIQATNMAESYKTLAGPDTQNTVTPSDARRYRQGHAFLSGEDDRGKHTLGYSSLSKIWEAGQMQIPRLLDWCRRIAGKIRSAGDIVTHSGLDYLSAGAVMTSIPQNVIWARWPREAFEELAPVMVRYTKDDGASHQCHILDLDLIVTGQDADHVRTRVFGAGLEYDVDFTLEDFFRGVIDDDRLQVLGGGTQRSLIDFMNEHYLDFYTTDGALFTGNELFPPTGPVQPIDHDQLEDWPWQDVDITAEITATNGTQSIHEHLRQQLENSASDVILYDHGTGEIADYVTVASVDEQTDIAFYHCKGSSRANAGARVEDVYEVCGQAQKSVAWATLASLERRLRLRNHGTFVRGSRDVLYRLIERAKTTRVRFSIVIVQPGISRRRLSDSIAEPLGATNDHVVHAGCSPLRAIVSP